MVDNRRTRGLGELEVGIGWLEVWMDLVGLSEDGVPVPTSFDDTVY